MANRALLVGVNKYRIAGSDLSGCVNDVTNMSNILAAHRRDTESHPPVYRVKE